MYSYALFFLATVGAGPVASEDANWYEKSFYLLHEDHHTQEAPEVGRDAGPAETRRLIDLSKPDVIQIHAKGNPGWTTYPTDIGHTPPHLARDVMAVWRDIASKGSYSFSVYYNIGRDGVIMSRRPEWNRVRADGKPWDRALCYHSGVAKGYLWPMVREILERYHPAGFWFDGSCFTISVCYCDKCRERFHNETGLKPPQGPNAPGWAAYHEMQRQVYREFIHDTAGLIHRIDPECLVAFNWAYSLRMPEKPNEGIAYLTGDIGNRVEGLSREAHWYDSLHVPFDLMTQVSTLQKVTPANGGRAALTMAPKPPPQIEQEMAVIIANGGRYFAWDNPMPESGLVPERLNFLGRHVAPFLRSRQPWCQGTERVPDVSLLHSAATHYAITEAAPTSFTRRNNRIDGATDASTRLHLNYEMLPDWRLEAGDVRSPLLLVEHPKVLTAQTVQGLIDFVHGGGTLFLTGMGLGCDQRLPDLLGIAKATGPKGPEPLMVNTPKGEHRFEHWLYRLEPGTANSLVMVKDAKGRTFPLLTANEVGRGRACYVALPLLTSHGKNVVPDELSRLVLEHVLPRAKRQVTVEAPATVEVVLRRCGNQYILHLVNMHPGEREVYERARRRFPVIREIPPVSGCRVSIRLPMKPSAVELQPQDVPLKGWKYQQGRVEAEIPAFAIHQMLVVDLSP